jgi:hypothetical protein
MSDTAHWRWAALGGLALTAALALWWLGSTRLALIQSADAARPSAQVLQALFVLRALALALWGPRVAAAGGARAGWQATLALVVPAWPLVVLAGSASVLSPWTLLLAEAALLAAAGLLPVLGHALRHLPGTSDRAELAATTAGVLLAAALWSSRGLWAAWAV